MLSFPVINIDFFQWMLNKRTRKEKWQRIEQQHVQTETQRVQVQYSNFQKNMSLEFQEMAWNADSQVFWEKDWANQIIYSTNQQPIAHLNSRKERKWFSPSSMKLSFFAEIFILYFFNSWRKSPSYRNQSIDFLCKSVDWFLYDRDLRHERVK